MAGKTKTPEGEDEIRALYPYPFFIEAIRRGEISGGSFTSLRHWSPHDHWQDVIIPSGDLTAEGTFRVLGNNHIEVDPTAYKPFTLFLSRAKSAYKAARATDVQHETFGWKADNSFLIGHTLITRNGVVEKCGVSEELKKYAPKLKRAGSLAEWTQAANQLFAPGFEHQGLAILAALAAPLMRYAPYPGIVYSIVHPLSGRGKTLAVEAATSVYGSDKSLWVSHRDEKVTTGDTIKSQFRAFALFKSLPIVIDELRETDPEKLRGLFLSFTDGNPPKGLTKEGAMRTTFGIWQTIMLSTSNKSLVDIVTVNNDPAAASRVFEVTAELPPNIDSANGNRIRAALMKNHGHAGVVFMTALLKPGVLEWAEKNVRDLVDKYTLELQTAGPKTGGDRYIASFLACVMVAGAVAKMAGVLDAPLEHLKAWCGERWTRQRIQIDMTQKSSIESISGFIRAHWANALIVNDEGRGRNESQPWRHPLRDPLVIRYETDTGRMLIDRARIQRWCLTENVHFAGLGSDLAEQNIMIDRDGYKNLGSGTYHKGVGQSRVWVLDTRHPVMSGELREVLDPAHAELTALEKVRSGR